MLVFYVFEEVSDLSHCQLHEVEAVQVFFVGHVASVGPIAEVFLALAARYICLAHDAWADPYINVICRRFRDAS